MGRVVTESEKENLQEKERKTVGFGRIKLLSGYLGFVGSIWRTGWS